MNPASLDTARLLDADFLHFLASAGWGVNAGVALFFLIPRRAPDARVADREFWITVAATFVAVSVVGIAGLLSHYGSLFRSLGNLDRVSHAAAAAATLLCLTLVPQAAGWRLVRTWRWGTLVLAGLVLGIVAVVPANASGWCIGLGAGAAGAILLVATWWGHRRAVHPRGRVRVLVALGALSLALAVVFDVRHSMAGPWNGTATHGGLDDVGQAWQGAVLAVAAVATFGVLWWKYLDVCTLPGIRARRGIFGLRPIHGLPMLECLVLGIGIVWFMASSRQAETYAGGRLRAELATVLGALAGEDAGGAGGSPEATAPRQVLERLVARSESFVAAAAWRETAAGEIELLAAMTQSRSPAPRDAARLVPARGDLDRVRAGGVLRWVHGRSAFEQAIVVTPMAGAAGVPPWSLSLAVDSQDLASLVATHRLQALAILALAVVIVAFAVVYTLRTLNEAELRLLKESAEAENHGRNAFLGMISHEIRTPLQSVLGYAELAEGAGLPDEPARHVRAIRTQGAILLRIVQDILDFSALRGGGLTLNPEVVSLRELLDDVQRGMAGRAQAKGIVFSTEIDGTVPLWVTVDRVRLTQVLLNLAVNAVKFTDRGGVRVAVGCSGVEDRTAAIEILVSDTGPGINPAQMRRLFEPFRKMRDDDTPGGGGVGLGLAISRQIVELLGGTITVESADGEGSAFRLGLDLPVASAVDVRPASVAAVAEVVSIPSLAGLHVLLIDDNPYVRDLLRDFLRKLGARVAVRADGTSGLEASAQEHVDVILLDLRLPDFQGADLAARLRAAGRSPTDPWIVGISAGVSDAEIQATLERGVNDFMLKPVSMAGLAETIRMSPAAAKIMPDPGTVAAAEGGLPADQRAVFFAELEPMFDRLEQSCLEEQGPRLGAEAHYLANGCMVTGFDEGLSVCREIELLAEAGAFDAARQRIAALRNRFATGASGAGGT